ncbi:MAG: lipoprotein, partial [Burkholderiales bacterium]|nr:lipoprotein [Burkholderiales bacterium]
MRRIVFAALVAAFLAGCSSQPTQPTAPIDDKSAAGAPGGAGASTAGAGSGGVAGAGAGAGSASAGAGAA